MEYRGTVEERPASTGSGVRERVWVSQPESFSESWASVRSWEKSFNTSPPGRRRPRSGDQIIVLYTLNIVHDNYHDSQYLFFGI